MVTPGHTTPLEPQLGVADSVRTRADPVLGPGPPPALGAGQDDEPDPG
ncbi:hypothetical protein [Nocardiopsis sp. MG754419]|nr:hypothetical protein [Nocardiopsis sp. MG754419]